MKKLLTRYVFLIVCFFVSFGVMAQKPPAPPGFECCEQFGEGTEYDDCLKSLNPDVYCDGAVPIDNSIYIYISIVAGVALASFVIARRIKT